MKTGSPFVFINDSGGARIQEGIDALSGYAKVFFQNTLLSGVVPQISLICGPCAGGAAYSPALTDFIIQTRHAQMFITGPQVIKKVTGEEVSAKDLGGPEAHMHYSGVVHFIAEDDADAARICQKLLSFLPSNNMEDPPRLDVEPVVSFDPELNEILPPSPRQGYDIHDVIARIVDDADFLEIQEHFAPNICIGLARVLGRTVGVVANNPSHKGRRAGHRLARTRARGSSASATRSTSPSSPLWTCRASCRAWSRSTAGIIRHGAKMLFAYSAATVPKITSSCARPSAGRTSRCAARTWGPTTPRRGPRLRSR
jgi:methylmalonyl-CoA carboxyltransferase large subunit